MTSSPLPRLFLTRHGDTAWTESHQKTGRTDLPLNERGEEHARQIGVQLSRFSFRQVFTSPLQRASRTCVLTGFGAAPKSIPICSNGTTADSRGSGPAKILAECPGWELFRDGCPDGESPGDVAARADRFIARVHKLAGDALAFSSGHISRMIAARWLGLPPAMGRFFYCDPASVGVLGFEHDSREEPVIRLWNYVTFPRE